MLREDRELLADLAGMCTDASVFALEYLAGALSIDAEEAYVLRLVDMAERLLVHAKHRKGLTLHGEPTPLVIGANAVVMGYQAPDLPPGSDTTSEGH